MVAFDEGKQVTKEVPGCYTKSVVSLEVTECYEYNDRFFCYLEK
jgi:hypothetical protein